MGPLQDRAFPSAPRRRCSVQTVTSGTLAGRNAASSPPRRLQGLRVETFYAETSASNQPHIVSPLAWPFSYCQSPH